MAKLYCSPGLLLLVTFGLACGYGLEGCINKYNEEHKVWCYNRNIENISRVVSKIPDNTTSITLSRNKIKAIPPNVFPRFRYLQELKLDRNNISFMIKHQFRGLRELMYLNLSCNSLFEIDPDAFNGLRQLKLLSLYKNHISDVPSGFFQALPQIRYVVLSGNKIQHLDGNLHSSTTLYNLDLSFNNISWIRLDGFPALAVLDLSYNPLLNPALRETYLGPSLTDLSVFGIEHQFLTGLPAELKHGLRKVSFSVSASDPNFTVCDVLREMPKLTTIYADLKGSQFRRNSSLLEGCPKLKLVILKNASFNDASSLQLMQSGESVTSFSLLNCGLQVIAERTFQGLRNLQHLSIMESNEVKIHKRAFTGLEKLTSLSIFKSGIYKPTTFWFHSLRHLETLFMAKNRLAKLLPYGFSMLYKLKKLSLTQNTLKVITDQHFSNLTSLQDLELNLNAITSIQNGAFKDLINLQALDLSGNRITTVSPDTLLGLGNLKMLKLYNNHLHFEEEASPFIGLKSLGVMDLKYQGPLSAGLGNLGQNFFKGVESLKYLSIGYTILTTLNPNVFAPLVNLQTLYLNSISMTSANLTWLLHPLVSLINLSLMKVDLDVLPPSLLSPQNSLKFLKLQCNHIHFLDESLHTNLPKLQYLDVMDNPLSCSCQNAWFKNWSLHSPDVQVAFAFDLHCGNDPRASHLWEFDEKACGYDSVSFYFFLSTALMDLSLLLLGLTWHKNRALLRYLILLLRSRLGGRRQKAGQGLFTYDAFISYSSRDAPWVMEQLVPHLEGPHGEGFRLCLHHRDFHVGTAILENIEMAIHSSRHTLCVVSRDFLRSEWCSLEFQLASLRLLCDRSDVLLLVFLEEIPDHCLSAYTRLRKVVRRNTYLLWPDNNAEREAFWVRLCEALKKGPEDLEDKGDKGFTQLLR